MEVEGWILDAYPGRAGEMVVWLKEPDGKAVRLTDGWTNCIYVSADEKSSLDYLTTRKEVKSLVASTDFVKKRERVSDFEERVVLRLVLREADKAEMLAKEVEALAEFGEYRIYNADLLPAQTYFVEKDLFPLAKVRVQSEGGVIRWEMLDSICSSTYEIPPLRRAVLRVEPGGGRIPKMSDPIGRIVLFTADGDQKEICGGSEVEKILELVETVNEADPDIIFVEDGDEFTTHYLVERAFANGILSRLVLSRDPVPMRRLTKRGSSYFTYGKVMHTPSSHRLYGRLNFDSERHFVFNDLGLDGLFEVARLCRMPLHKGSRASIGKCLSSMQFNVAHRDNTLIPWKPTRAEVPKTARQLLTGDRGGFVYEPRVGVHERVGEIDFTSLYPSIMTKYNISAETVLCECCRGSKVRVPDIGYNICERRRGVIPRSLELILEKRMTYKKMKGEETALRKVYEARADALKGILVCSFGYLSYRNAKFGLIDCHVAVCAYARRTLLQSVRVAERLGFEVVHGIVDSLWVKKDRATPEDFETLRAEIERETGLPLSFEGIYRWVAFLPSRIHRGVPVLNRYFGVYEDGSLKLRGIEERRRDTARLVKNCQLEILKLLATAEDLKGTRSLLPAALDILRSYADFVRSGEASLGDLVIANRLSKKADEYKVTTAQSAAVAQLKENGLELQAGQNVAYVITNQRSADIYRKSRPFELTDEATEYDKEAYVALLVRGVSSILTPFGFTEEALSDVAKRGTESVPLASSV
ncbi:MAG TPA: DNA polymerase domain-containing protein [Nitrososphaerales archaeon]|nr:DNA polymerase domain-containing protein [Nitrososphaerales archaeon]